MENVQGWHIKRWGILGWVETVLKVAAIGVAVILFINTSGADGLTLSGHPRLFSVILLALLTLATLGQISLRLKLKDIIAMAFAMGFLIGHLCLLIGMLRAPDVLSYPLAFGVLVLLGDVVKLRFMQVTHYTEAGVGTSGLIKLVCVILGLYGAFVAGLLVG